MALKPAGTLPWFGSNNSWEAALGPGYTNPYPDSNFKPVSKGAATGHQQPITLINASYANPVHQSYVNSGQWAPAMQAGQNYAKANGVAMMYYLSYPSYDGNISWSKLKECAQMMVQYCTGYTVFMNIANEIISSSGINMGVSPWSDLGGAGSSGFDGLINGIKQLRAMFGSNVKWGLNDYNIMDDSVGGGCFKLDGAIKAYKACAANGAALDWIGSEGYWMNYKWEGYSDPLAMIKATCDKFAAAVPNCGIIFTEFSPMASAKGTPKWSKQSDAWKNLVGAFVAHPAVIGVSGPWGGMRLSSVWNGDSGEGAKLNWIWNDTSGNAPNDPDQTGQTGPGAVTGTLGWLQSQAAGWAGGGTPPDPNPPMESAEGTTVLNDSGGTITDSTGANWTCSGGVVKRNGANAGYSANVTKIAYYSHVVWQTNNAGGWWKWTGSAWQEGTDPTPKPPNPDNPLASGTYTVPAGTKIVVP